jgi:hypothetical protein
MKLTREERAFNAVNRIWVRGERIKDKMARELAKELLPKWAEAHAALRPSGGFIPVEFMATAIRVEAEVRCEPTLVDGQRDDRFVCVGDEEALAAVLWVCGTKDAGQLGRDALGELTPTGEFRWASAIAATAGGE